MNHMLTLIGAQAADIDLAVRVITAAGGVTGQAEAQGAIANLPFRGLEPGAVEQDLRTALTGRPIDLLARPWPMPKCRLFVADMDATMVVEETLDELAAHVGLKDRIAAITQKAMRGEVDFAEAVRERVGLLAGLPISAIEETLAAITLSPGAAETVAALNAAGVHTVLISGGFTIFTAAVAKQLGFAEHHGNTLELSADGRSLTGRVLEPIRGKEYKLEQLRAIAARLGIDAAETCAIGDGANDLPMLQAAGLGIGYRAKPAVAAAARARIDHSDLSTVLAYLGIQRGA